LRRRGEAREKITQRRRVRREEKARGLGGREESGKDKEGL
jgi:hypothetical protein